MQRATSSNPTSRRSNVTNSGTPPASAFASLATPSPAHSPFSSNDNSNSSVNMSSTCFRSRRRVTLIALLGFATIIALTLRSENRITKSLHVEYHFYNAFGSGGGVTGSGRRVDGSRLVSAPDNLRSSRAAGPGMGMDADTNSNGIPEHRRQRRPTKPIREISLIGERNSGTTWMTSHLQKCFGGSGSGGNSNSSAVGEGGVIVRDYLIRYKHFFQHEGVRENNQSENTYVIAMFRNPYHWIEAMRAVPHHAPMHYKLGWRDYLETPWTMPRSPADLELLEEMEEEKEGEGEGVDAAVDTTKIKCQYGYTYNRINSCLRDPFRDDEDYAEYFKRYWKSLAANNGTKPQQGGELKLPGYSGKRPQYEMRDDGSGEPYESILQLRADKIHNFLSIANWEWVGGFRPLRYEEMLREGTAALIADLERLTGVKANCEPSPPQNRPQRELSPEFIEYMNDHVDWDAERRVGYRKLSFMMDD